MRIYENEPQCFVAAAEMFLVGLTISTCLHSILRFVQGSTRYTESLWWNCNMTKLVESRERECRNKRQAGGEWCKGEQEVEINLNTFYLFLES